MSLIAGVGANYMGHKLWLVDVATPNMTENNEVNIMRGIVIPYGSKHLLRRYLTAQINAQRLPQKVLGSIGQDIFELFSFAHHSWGPSFFHWELPLPRSEAWRGRNQCDSVRSGSGSAGKKKGCCWSLVNLSKLGLKLLWLKQCHKAPIWEGFI